MNRKYFVLKALAMALGLTLYVVSFYIIFLFGPKSDIPMMIVALVLLEVGCTLEVYAIFILDETNRIDLRTCPSGTRVKIFKPFFLKWRHFRYDFLGMYFCGSRLNQMEFLPVCSELKRLAVRDKGMFYRIFNISDVTDLIFEEKSDEARCQRLCVVMTLNSVDIPRVEMQFIQKPIKKDSRNYYYIKDQVKQLFEVLHKRF